MLDIAAGILAVIIILVALAVVGGTLFYTWRLIIGGAQILLTPTPTHHRRG